MAAAIGTVMAQMDLDISNFLESLRQSQSAIQQNMSNMTSVSNTAMESISSRMSSVGESMTGVGKSLSVGLTLPIVGVGVAAIGMATDVVSSTNKIQTGLGVTASEAEKLTDVAKDIWKNGFGEDLDEATQAVIEIKQSIKDISDVDLKTLTESAFTLKDAFGAEINESTRTASVMMKNFGITGQEAMDIITVGYQKGGNFSDELLDSLREYAPQFKGMGISAKDSLGILIKGAESGAFNLDKVGDAVKEMMIRTTDGSKASTEAFQALGFNAEEMTKKFASGGETAQSAFKATLVAISSIKDPVKQQQIGVQLLGTQYEDLRGTVINTMKDGIGSIKSVEGATKTAGDALYNNLGSKMSGMWRQMQEALMPFGQMLLDLANNIMPTITSAIKTVTDTMKGMSPEAQTMILAIAGIAAAIGPILVVIGTLVSSIGSIVGAISAASGAIAAAGGVMAVLTGPIGLTIGAIVALVAGCVLLYQNWDTVVETFRNGSPVVQVLIGVLGLLASPFVIIVGAIKGVQSAMSDAIPEINLFGEGIGDATKKAVQGYLDLDANANKSLMQLKATSSIITKEMSDTLVTTFDTMGTQIKAGMDKHYQDSLGVITTFFSKSKALTDTEEKAILTKMNASNEAKKKSVEDGETQIKTILEKATKEKRALTTEEQIAINNIQTKMKEGAVKALSNTELESKAILEKMRLQASDITARQATEVVKNSLEQKNKAVQSAETQYTETVKNIIKQRDEVGSITKDQATKLIAEAEKQKNEAVIKATYMHTQVVSEAKKQAKEHVNEVDWTTGELKSKWDIWYENEKKFWSNSLAGLGTWWEDIKKKNKEEEEKRLAQQKLDNEALAKAFSDMWDKVVKFFSEGWNKVKNWASNTVAEFKQLGSDIAQGIANGITGSKKNVTDSSKELTDAVKNTIIDDMGISSPSKVTTKYGEHVGEGFAVGIKSQEPAVKSATDDLINQAKASFDNSKQWIDERKYYNQLSLQEELESWQRVQARYDVGTEQRKEADREVYRIKQDINKKSIEDEKARLKTIEDTEKSAFDNSKKWIDEKKYFGEQTLQEELASWQRVQARYKEGTEQRKEADREVYRIKKAINDESIQGEKDRIKAVEDAENQALKNAEEVAKKKADLEKKSLQDAKDWLDQRKYYGEVTLADELRAWKTIQSEYNQGSEERKQADKEVYRVNQELSKLRNQAAKQRDDELKKLYTDVKNELIEIEKRYSTEKEKISKDSLDRKIKLETDYFNTASALANKAIEDTKKANDTYTKALEDKEKSLYNFMGVFDEMGKKQEISGTQLVENLKAQVQSFADWQEDIKKLVSRGMDEGVVDELRAMGPKAGAQIQALTTLSDAELAIYTELWKKKHEQAKEEATLELEGLEKETKIIVDNINKDTNIKLEELKKHYDTNYKAIEIGAEAELLKLEQSNELATSRINIDAQTKLELLEGVYQASLADINRDSGISLESLKASFTEKNKKINENTITDMVALATTYSTGMNTIQTETKTSLEALTANAKTETGVLIAAVTQNVVDGTPIISLAVSLLCADILSHFVGLVTTITTGTGALIVSLIQTILLVTPIISLAVGLLCANILSHFVGLIKATITAGENIMLGLKTGLENKELEVRAVAARIALAVARAMAESLKIKSPSRVMMEMGENITDGLMIGMLSRQEALLNATRGMSTSITSSIQSKGSFGGTVKGNSSQDGQSRTINLTVNQSITDRKTADYAKDSIVKIFQGRGLGGAFV